MGFEALIEKVRQAEVALEAKERQTSADLRQVRASWRSMWTPGRIVLAGLASGFLVGRAEPFKKAAGGGTLQLISALSGLFAGGSAQAAADQASDAARAADSGGPPPGGRQRAEATRHEAGPAAPRADAAPARPAPAASPSSARPYEIPETFRDQGQL